MKSKIEPRPLSPQVDFSAPDFLASFHQAADAFDAKHATTKKAARAQLHKEGYLTKKGKVTKLYRSPE